MTFTDLAKAHVRTIVPALVGLVITLALRVGVDLHGYAPFITTAVTSIYYTSARLAEHYLSPRFGWLLGVASVPKYVAPEAAPEAAPAKRRRRDAGHGDLVTVLIVVLVVLAILLLIGAIR